MKFQLNKISPYVWEIPKSGNMNVPGRIFASDNLIANIEKDESPIQVQNVAHLPGITGYSFAMPDIHYGYGFPIGGVAATDYETGVISPGGVGYDINCGVRLIHTNLDIMTIKPHLKKLMNRLFQSIPTGIGSKNAIKKLSNKELMKVLQNGAGWAVNNGYGTTDDLNFIEENGKMESAVPELISDRALKRGAPQLGTLGSGNHFVELSKVATIYDDEAAKVMDIKLNQILIQIHTGSRGLGYQVCDESIKKVMAAVNKYNISIPDRQLVCAPLSSPEGQNYFGEMSAAANFAFANRQIIYSLIERNILQTLKLTPRELGYSLIWDIAHNIAKIESHNFKGKEQKFCVHRKGATRAFGPDSPGIPAKYKTIGQPVLIPGDMGTESYVCVGTKKAMSETFGSSCHGAGRLLSRKKASKISHTRNIYEDIRNSGVFVLSNGKRTLAEEMPYAYKDVSEVVNTMHNAGITKKVARLVPIGVIKG